MAVSIDARVGQREIDAAREGGADIEGVTSMQGTPVSPVEQQITFGGYPNQIGPSFLSDQGLLNQGTTTNVIDIINSLHPDFVANASPQELDYAISVVQGKAPYAEGVLSGPTVSRQPPWVGTRTQTTGTGPTRKEATAKEIEKYEKAIKKTEESQAKIAKINKELQKQIDNMQRWYTSPARAEALVGPPLGSGGNVGAYIEQQQMGMGPPLGGGNMPTYSGTPTFVEDESAWGAGEYLGAPTFVEDESAWGAGRYQPTINIEDDPLGQVIASTGHPDWGMSGTPMNPPTAVRRADGTVEMIEMPVPKSRVSVIDVPKAKATAKSKYGAWKGKYNKLTAKQNLENLDTFRKARMSDFEKRFGSAKHFGLTRPTVNGQKISWEDNRLRNEYMRTDQFLNDYDTVYGTSKGAKMLGSAYSSGLGFVGPTLQNMINKKGAGNADTFEDVLNKIRDPKTGAYLYEGEAESAPTHPREKVSGGFWGLLSFAKENKKLFKSLSSDELWALVSDPDEFWAFYEDALNAQ